MRQPKVTMPERRSPQVPTERPLPSRGAGPTLTALWLAGIVVLGAALRFYHLGTKSYWLDENATIRIASLPLRSLFYVLLIPNRSPLYLLLVHGWMTISGTSETLIRLPSALAGIATLPLIFVVGRSLVSREAGLLAAAFLAVSEFAIYQSQQARYYSFVLLFTLLAAWFTIRARDHGQTRDFLLLTITSLLLVATHYLAACWLLALWLYLLLRRPWTRGAAGTARQWLTWQALTVIGLLPVPLLIIRTLVRDLDTSVDWISAPAPWAPLRDAAMYLLPQHAPANASIGAALIALGLGLVGILRHRKAGATSDHTASPQIAPRPQTETLWLLGLWASCPILIPFALSWVLPPIYVARYTGPALPAVLLLVAAGLLALRPLLPLPLALLLLAIPIVPGLANYYASPGTEDWRAIAAQVTAESQPSDLIVFAPSEGGSMRQTFDRYDHSQLNRCDLDRNLPDDRAITTALDACSAGHERVWVIVRYNADNNPCYAANLANYFLIGEPPGLTRRNEAHLAPLHLLLFERKAP